MTTERKPIGVFAYGGSPIEHLPWRRTRALLAEAALQGAELLFFSTDDCCFARHHRFPFLSLTPGPSPFSSTKITPAFSSAAIILSLPA